MHSPSRSRNAAASAVSSSSRLAVADEGSASRRTWLENGRPDNANGLSVIVSPGVLLLKGVRVKGEGESWLGASNSRKCHDEGTDHICQCGRPWQDARWAGHPRLVWERTASACAADSHPKVAIFQSRVRKEKESGLMFGPEGWGRHHGYSSMVTHNCRMRTDAFLRHELRATKDTPGRGRSASTATSGFGILKGRMGRTQKMRQKGE